jgi:hypothetical protein
MAASKAYSHPYFYSGGAALFKGCQGSRTVLAFILTENQGPIRIVVPQEKEGARWIRMVESMEVVKLP